MKKYAFGIDVGGTTVKCGLFSTAGEVLDKWEVRTRTEDSGKNILPDVAKSVLTKIEQKQLPKEEIAGIGIGVPGPVDEKGVIAVAVNLHWGRKDIVREMEELTGLKVKAGNDANVAALGEQWQGGGRGTRDMIMVTLGTGVGGGIIVNDKMLTGINGAAGEIGHIVIEADGEHCSCGRDGCFEAYSSATALIRMTKDALIRDRNKESAMWKIIDNSIDNVNGKTPFDAAQAGDEIAQKVVDKYIHYLGIGCANLINIFQPDVLCLGGGISKQGDSLIEPLIKVIEKERFAGNVTKQTRVCEATLGNDAGIIGAALLYTNN